MKGILFALPLLGFLPLVGTEKPEPETASGWIKHEKNPVLGGALGTCFDVSLLREGKGYRMWFSWRPRQSIALVQSKDGLAWGKPAVVLGPNKASGWEEGENRTVVHKKRGMYRSWYTGQANGDAWLDYATN